MNVHDMRGSAVRACQITSSQQQRGLNNPAGVNEAGGAVSTKRKRNGVAGAGSGRRSGRRQAMPGMLPQNSAARRGSR